MTSRDTQFAGDRTPDGRVEGIVLALLALASLFFFVHPWYDATYDGSMYLSCARSIVDGDGYTYLGEPFRIRPPGWSILLAPIVAAFDYQPLILNIFTSLFGVAALVLMYFYALPRLGVMLSIGVSFVVWLNPEFRALCNQTLSDVPGLAFLFACLLLDRWARKRPTLARGFLLGLAIGLASYARSVHVFLAPAIVLSRLLGRRGEADAVEGRSVSRSSLALIAGTVLMLVPWGVRNGIVESPAVPPDQHPLYDYSTAMFHQDKGDPESPRITSDAFVARAELRTAQVLSAVGTRLRDEQASVFRAALGALVLAAGVWLLVRKRDTAEFFLLGAAGALCIYFGFAERLVLPVFVLGLISATQVTRDVIGRVAGRRAAPVVFALLVVLAATDARTRVKWGAIEAESARFEARRESLEGRVEEDTTLATAVGHNFSIFLGRPVYSLQIAMKCARDRQESEEILDRTLERHGIEAIVLSKDRHEALLEVLAARHAPEDLAGEWTLVRVE